MKTIISEKKVISFRHIQSFVASLFMRRFILFAIFISFFVSGQKIQAKEYVVSHGTLHRFAAHHTYMTLSKAVHEAGKDDTTEDKTIVIMGGIYPEGPLTIQTKLTIVNRKVFTDQPAVVGNVKYEVEEAEICIPALCTEKGRSGHEAFGACSKNLLNPPYCQAPDAYLENGSLREPFGQTVEAVVYYPSDPQPLKPLPTLIYVHGYRHPESEACSYESPEFTESYKQARTLLRSLAAYGFVVISIDYTRNGDGSEDDDMRYPYYVNDHGEIVISTLAYLANKSDGSDIWLKNKIDSTLIGLIGHSRGGFMVYHTAYVYRKGWPRLDFSSFLNPEVLANQPYTEEHLLPSLKKVKIWAVGLITTGEPILTDMNDLPTLVIHGTQEPSKWHKCRQVENQPLNTYCKINPPKHLAVVEGANHYGHTDGICLKPNSSKCGTAGSRGGTYYIGGDGACTVGGKSGSKARELQRIVTGIYLNAFFSFYMRDDISNGFYIQQREGEKCSTGNSIKYSTCQPWLRFESLMKNNVAVNVCSVP